MEYEEEDFPVPQGSADMSAFAHLVADEPRPPESEESPAVPRCPTGPSARFQNSRKAPRGAGAAARRGKAGPSRGHKDWGGRAFGGGGGVGGDGGGGEGSGVWVSSGPRVAAPGIRSPLVVPAGARPTGTPAGFQGRRPLQTFSSGPGHSLQGSAFGPEGLGRGNGWGVGTDGLAGTGNALGSSPAGGETALERISGVRVKPWSMTPEAATQHLGSARFHRLQTLRSLALGGSAAGSWATAGVLARKTATRESKAGNPYASWTLSDLQGHEAQLLLLGAAFTRHWKEVEGCVVLVLGAEASPGQLGYTSRVFLKVFKAQQVLVLGQAQDFGICAGGQQDPSKPPCTAVVNKTQGPFCAEHAGEQYHKFKTHRLELGGGQFSTSTFLHRAKKLRKKQVLLPEDEAQTDRAARKATPQDLKGLLRNKENLTSRSCSQGVRFLALASGERPPLQPMGQMPRAAAAAMGKGVSQSKRVVPPEPEGARPASRAGAAEAGASPGEGAQRSAGGTEGCPQEPSSSATQGRSNAAEPGLRGQEGRQDSGAQGMRSGAPTPGSQERAGHNASGSPRPKRARDPDPGGADEMGSGAGPDADAAFGGPEGGTAASEGGADGGRRGEGAPVVCLDTDSDSDQDLGNLPEELISQWRNKRGQ